MISFDCRNKILLLLELNKAVYISQFFTLVTRVITDRGALVARSLSINCMKVHTLYDSWLYWRSSTKYNCKQKSRA